MKTIDTYINEKLRLTTKHQYTCQPRNKYELQRIIIQRIKDDGSECDLNDIDVSKITDMRNLFDVDMDKIFKYFNGDVSMWDVSNVKDMYAMFYGCENFDCDISKWNVSNVKIMGFMFWNCKKFNQDLSSWDVSKVESMKDMFRKCEKFNQDLDSWDIVNVKNMWGVFYECPTTPKWYNKDKWETEYI